MKILTFLFIAIFSLTLTQSTLQAEECSQCPMPSPKIAPEFNRLKELVGTWKGSTKMQGKDQEIMVEYQLTSGGSTLVEHLFKGTPHEMVSVYYSVGEKVFMTHYCMLGNQPHLQLEKAKDNTLEFSLADPSGLQSKNEIHMHALALTFTDKNSIVQKWTGFENGKPKESTTINLSRVQ
ncbi:MAG: hypothetical protein K1X66_00620 [Verrucomicrobiae bacterium]|nr:hypothetical protein [Verrucomicrobiae bacterium]